MSERRPNFLCIVTDQQRADHLSCMGDRVLRTPNIDRIAAQGQRFSRAYVNNPLCMPSRATLFTGLTPRAHGVRTNGIPLDPRVPTMTEALRTAGYRTHGVGKIHLNTFGLPRHARTPDLDPRDFPEARAMWDAGLVARLPNPYYGLETVDFVGGHGNWLWGDYMKWLQAEHPNAVPLLQPDEALEPRTGADQSWKSSLPAELHHSTWIADRAVEFLEDQAQADQPFFLWCSFPDPHHPYCPPAPWCRAYAPADAPPPVRRSGELRDLPPHFLAQHTSHLQTSGRGAPTEMPDAHLREIVAHTYGMIGLVDQQVGRLLDCLEEQDLTRDTVVVFLSDHGDLMGDHWLINKGPYHFDGLVRVPFLWSWPGRFDAGREVPALASLLDFAPTVLDLAGVPVPEGRAPAEPEAPDMPPAWPGLSLAPILTGQAERVQSTLLIENDEDYLGLRLRTLVTETHKLTVYPGRPYGELFNKREDPHELHNRWHDPAYRKLRERMVNLLMERLALTDSAVPRRLCHA